MTHQVYVIENPSRKRSVGLSEDGQLRLGQHNSGESGWTKGKGPWTPIWTSEAMSLSDARKLENKLKRQKEAQASAPLQASLVQSAHIPATAGS